MEHSKEFTDYLQSKNLATTTQKAYCKYVTLFLTWYQHDPINCTKKDLLHYFAHLKNNTHQQHVSRRNACTALNHYFTALQQAGIIEHNPVAFIQIRGTNKKQLYHIYTPDELTQLADNFYAVFIAGFDDSNVRLSTSQRTASFLSRHRNYIMLTFLLYQGLPTHELPLINVNDINLNKAVLKISSNKSGVRTLPLQAAQMGTLLHYINHIRPQFLQHCGQTDKLFFSLSAEQYDKSFSKPLRALTKQVKSIDGGFKNFAQTRASVITHWIQTEGLRKAQYLAGHKTIVSTENYLPNDMESLINEVQKFNPFS
jgi:site-specific recombinase XerD